MSITFILCPTWCSGVAADPRETTYEIGLVVTSVLYNRRLRRLLFGDRCEPGGIALT